MTQDQALSILKTGVNVFLTGEPGSGKTYTINSYVSYLRKHGVSPAITASTGIAATHIGGMTIHSWSGIGIKTKLEKHDLDKIASNSRLAGRINRTKVLIIDEVSMLAPQTLSMIDAVCRRIKQNTEPFGGLQAVLVGDFFQLPPIFKKELQDKRLAELFAEQTMARFAYDSPVWERAKPKVCYITEQHRQDDNTFLALLSAIRANGFNEEHFEHIEACKIEYSLAPESAPKLFSHNIDVDRVNDAQLAKLPDPAKSFAMFSQGSTALVEVLKKSCLSPETLHLKIGAAVMFTKNDPGRRFVNGTLGLVEGFNKITKYPIIKIRSGKRVEAEPMDWTVEENGKIRARVKQLPLRLAWAITVHKSQGMSLDEAVMDLSSVFEFGQGYVALSRVRKLSGLYLLGWNERTFQVDPEVLTRDESFRSASAEIELSLAGLPPDELLNQHKDFISSCGGNNKNGIGTGFDKIREKHPNAYCPWDQIQDEKLRELFAASFSIPELAKFLGRNKGAISSRLVKLGLMELKH